MSDREWRKRTRERKINCVVGRLDRRRWHTAAEVAYDLGISDAIARKYLCLAVAAGKAEADPPLGMGTGSAYRLFKLSPRLGHAAQKLERASGVVRGTPP